MWRIVKRTLLVLWLAAACASCRVDIEVDVVTEDDGSGVVTVTATADADIVAQAPNIATDLRFDDIAAAGWLVDGPTPTESGGIQVVLTHTFQTPAEGTALLADIGGDQGPLVGITLARTVVKRTTTYTLNGTLQVSGGLDAFSDAELLSSVGATPFATQIAGAGLAPSDAIGITFSASMPGSIDNTTSVAEEGLAWTVPLDGTAVDVATLSETKDTSNAWASPVARGARIALIAWGAISVCIMIYVMVLRRRRRIENQPWY